MQIGLALTLLMGTKSRERIYGASTLPRRPNMARDYDPPSSGAPVAARERTHVRFTPGGAELFA